MSNIDTLLKKVGGAAVLAGKLGLHQYSVDRWRKNGVPITYWEYLSKHYSLSIDDLYHITIQILKKRNGTTRSK